LRCLLLLLLLQVALVNGVPKTLSFKDCLEHFLEFREGVVQRRAAHALAKATARLHLVEGLLLALQQLDEVVQVHTLFFWFTLFFGMHFCPYNLCLVLGWLA
jgi:hypothetical protein